MKKFIFLVSAILALSAGACDWGKGSVAPVVATVTRQQVNVPFDYRDCTAPSAVTFTVVAKKSQQYYSARVLDVVTGVEYTLPPYRPLSNSFVFPPLPAAGHFYYVELFNAKQGQITISVYAQ